MDAHDHLALLIAVIAQNGPTPLHPDDIHAAQGLALTMWEADGAVWLRTDEKPAVTSSQAATSRPQMVDCDHNDMKCPRAVRPAGDVTELDRSSMSTSLPSIPPAANSCECGCGESPAVGRRYISGHNLRRLERSEAHRQALSDALRHAWATKRQRMPLGSRRKDANGYWLVKVREGGGRWDKEHVLIAQEVAGRALRPGEHVHHINCVKDDNRPENLVILDGGDHRRAHGSLNRLVDGLIRDGHIYFDADSGEYRRA